MKYLKGLVMLLILTILDNHLFKEEKVEKRFEAKQWFINLLLLGAVLMLLTCDLSAQIVRATKVDMDRYAGVTKCDGNGNIEILVSTQVPPHAVRDVMLHEGVHVLQIRNMMGRHNSCQEAYNALVGNLHLLMTFEVEAYCVVLNIESENQNDMFSGIDRLASFLWDTNHGNFKNYNDLKALVIDQCGKTSGNIPNVRFISSEGAVALFDISQQVTIPPVQKDGTATRPP